MTLQAKKKARDVLSGIDTVIFDMDGLMIDSEPLHVQAYDTVLQKLGKHLTETENSKLYVGISDKDVTADLVRRHNLPVSAVALEKQKQQAYSELIKYVKPLEGLEELLKKLKNRDYKMVVASSSSLDEIKIIMKALNTEGCFEAYFSAQQVEHGKPAPDIFLFAAREIGADPARCLVLEDAPSGAKAARAASMSCFVVPSRETKGADFSNATMQFSDLSEIADIIS